LDVFIIPQIQENASSKIAQKIVEKKVELLCFAQIPGAAGVDGRPKKKRKRWISPPFRYL
jgi:hypothetical protein